MTEAVVVGASAAGLYAASQLAGAGVSTTVLERARSLGPAPRTLIVTSAVRDVLGPSMDESLLHEIRSFELRANGTFATVKLRRPDLIVERRTLIRGLARVASDAGVEIRFGSPVRDVRPAGQGVLVDSESGALSATTVVGADGVNSRVARRAGWPAPPTVSLIQACVRLPEDLDPNTVRVWFRPRETPYFYWLVPHSPTAGVLGLIVPAAHRARGLLDSFLQEQRLCAAGYQAARIPIYTRWEPVRRRFGRGEVFVVGDAAAHVKVTTVGGIVTGFRGTRGVVRSIVDGRPAPELRALRRELNRHRLIRTALHRFSEDDYSRLIAAIGDGARTVLGEVNRDDARALTARLVMRKPGLLGLGLRALLRR